MPLRGSADRLGAPLVERAHRGGLRAQSHRPAEVRLLVAALDLISINYTDGF